MSKSLQKDLGNFILSFQTEYILSLMVLNKTKEQIEKGLKTRKKFHIKKSIKEINELKKQLKNRYNSIEKILNDIINFYNFILKNDFTGDKK